MRLDLPGVARAFSELEPGSVFYFGRRGRTLIGIKTFETAQGSERFYSGVALEHPDLNGMPGLISGHLFGNGPVLWIPDTTLTVPTGRDAWRFSRDVNEGPGDLLVTRDRTLLLVGAGLDRLARIDIQTGEAQNPSFAETPLIVSRWSIVRENAGHSESLYEHSPEVSAR